MKTFLKENYIFVISSIVFIGLIVGVFELKKMQNQNQIEITPTDINQNISTSSTVDTVKNPAPVPTPAINTQIQQRIPNREDDSQSEREDN